MDSDQYQTADPGVRDAILSSMIKRVDNAVFQEIQAFIKGDRAGGVKRFDLKTDGVGYSVSNEKAVAPVRRQVDSSASGSSTAASPSPPSLTSPSGRRRAACLRRKHPALARG
nr:hypothetical protein GCM10020093_118660 [Planobispora longispora]